MYGSDAGVNRTRHWLILRQVVDGILCNFDLILLLFESTLRVSFVTEVLETEPSASFTPAECSTLKFYLDAKCSQVVQTECDLVAILPQLPV